MICNTGVLVVQNDLCRKDPIILILRYKSIGITTYRDDLVRRKSDIPRWILSNAIGIYYVSLHDTCLSIGVLSYQPIVFLYIHLSHQ